LIALRLRLAAWKTALRVRLSPELQQQTFEIGSGYSGSIEIELFKKQQNILGFIDIIMLSYL
jgi:hypothetical protein